MDIDERDRRQISRVPLFTDLLPATLEKVIAGGMVFSYPRGVTLFHQGEMPECLHIVLEGEIGLFGNEGGEETVVELLEPGEVFIAAAVFTERPYLMDAKVVKPARLLLLPAPAFRAELRNSPDLAVAMLGALSRHFRMLVREVKNLKLKSSAQRLAAYLLTLADGEADHVYVRLPHPKALIAQRIGIRAETLSRHFTTLREEGVRVRGNAVEIVSVAKLSAFCRDDEDAV